MGFYSDLMGYSWDIPGLVNILTYIANWKDPPLLMGKSTISMAIFNCYVSSPEGNGYDWSNLILIHWDSNSFTY